MAGQIVVHILGDTAHLSRSLNKVQRDLASLRMAFDDLNKGARTAALVLGGVAAAGLGAGVVAGGVLAGGMLAAAGAATFLAFQSEEVSQAFDETKETWKKLSSEMTKPMHTPLIKFFGTLSDIFENKLGPSITRISEQMGDFLQDLGGRLGPVAEKIGGMLESAFTAGYLPIMAMVDGIGTLSDGFREFFDTLNSSAAATFITELFNAFKAILPIFAQLLNALLPVGTAILQALIPSFAALADFIATTVTPVLERITQWIKDNPKFITQLVAALVLLKVAIGAVSAVLGILAIAKLAPFIALCALLATVLLPIAGQIKDALMPAFNALKTTLNGLRPVFDTMVKNLQGSFLSAFQKIGEVLPVVIGLFGSLLRIIMPLVDLIAFTFLLVLEQLLDLWAAVIPYVKQFTDLIGGDLNNNLGTVKDGIRWVVEGLGDLLLKLAPVIGAVFQFASYLYTDTKLALMGARDQVGWFGATLLWLKDTFGPVFTAFFEWIKVLNNTALTAEERKQQLSETFQRLKEAITLAMGEAKTKLGEIWNAIWVKIQEVWDTQIFPWLSQKMDEISKMLGEKARTWLTDMRDSLVKNAHKIPGIMIGIGIDIVMGLAKGMWQMKNVVYRAAMDLVGQIPGVVKNLLGIRSPSRLMMEMGRFTGEGFALGIEDEIGNVKKAAIALGETAIKAVKGSGSMSAAFEGFGVRADLHIERGLAASAGGRAPVSITVNAGLSNPEETGREVVKAIRDYERINGNGWRN